MERSTWISLYRWITRRPAVPDGATGFPYTSAQQPVIIAFIAVSAIEIPVAHLIIPWMWLKIIFLIIGVWGLGWMFGFLAGVRLGPHLIDEAGLRIRHGFTVDLAIPADAIGTVSQRLRSLDSGKTLQQQDTAHGTAVIVAVTSQTNVELRLTRPITVELKTGPVKAIEIRCYADDPGAMAAAVRSMIPSCPS